MIDQINKALYLGFGVILLVLALTSFYNNNQSFLSYSRLYKEVRLEDAGWVRDVSSEIVNPLGITASDEGVIGHGLVYRGSEFKAQLLVMNQESKEYTLFNEGILVEVDKYINLYNNISDGEELLIRVDENIKAVYITSL